MSVNALFERLYRARGASLKRLLQGMVGNAADPEDVLHDAYVKLSGREFAVAHEGLIVHAAKNLALDRRRGERVRQRLCHDLTSEQVAPAPLRPDDAFAAQQELRDLFQALEALPKRRVQILLLARADGMTYKEIASTLGISLSTVEKEMAAALAFCGKWRLRREVA